jgi:hypothetical protein
MGEIKVITMDLNGVLEKLQNQLGMTPEDLCRFDEATNHPYECRCALCQDWWDQMGPEDEPETDA